MLNYKILIKITGSIAAYKSVYLISKLIKAGFEVEVAATSSALKFIGQATIEGMTHRPVYTDSFEPGRMMSHIDLVKWADLTIVVPADANTINKFANGIADNLITSLFLAHDREKPYLIAPAMNTAMYNHPATQASLNKLSEWGIHILPTDEGYLACGDEGLGKLLDPDLIFGYIGSDLHSSYNKDYKVLITGGGTIENIDGMRHISNKSSGRTAVKIAENFYIKGTDVMLLLSESAVKPAFDLNFIEFNSFQSLKNVLRSELTLKKYDLVIHLAAVSDYSPVNINVKGETIELPLTEKLDSSADSVTVTFNKNIKLVNHIKEWSLNKDVKLVAFKLLDDRNDEKKANEIKKLFDNSKADAIVFNALSDRDNDVQRSFEIIDVDGKSNKADTADDLSEELFNQWRSE
ncbi:Phosphopantothenoylcysteine decarboxylase / Phosphopantothenoylcysteine synthetase [hydrothermal vent metagenome]|uniref:Phosphopantothenoylcysteine decarboxylase / Phosphopantothenoylcysteine synthetase n=1 Tax=hydrothermal vent metagenome TaxID=652676 RepID=A0A3B1C7U5_9ZZZZ